jgi:hypothetical protein
MKNGKRYLAALVVLILAIAAFSYFGATRISAQPAPADVAAIIGQSISTKVVMLKLENQHGEPRLVNGKVSFDHPVAASWISVVGVDIKFDKDTEKYINRQLFSVDPFAKIVNGKDVEVSGKLGIRDGTGDFDDTYEGTITVAVTALLAEK